MWCCVGAEHCSVPLLYSSPLIGFTLILLQSSVLGWAALRAGVCFPPPCLVESACAWILSTNLFCSLPAWLIVHKAVRDDSNQPQLSLSWRSRCKTCRRALKHYLVLLVLFLALPSPSLLTCLWPHPPHYAHSQVPAPFCFPHVQTLQSADTHTHSAQRLPSWDAVAAVCSSVEWVLSCLYPFVAAVMKRGVDVKLVEQGCWTISQLS